jgi:hypothetical protein
MQVVIPNPFDALATGRRPPVRRRGEECVRALSERTIAYYREAAERMGARLLDGDADAETLAETIAKESLDRYYTRL